MVQIKLKLEHELFMYFVPNIVSDGLIYKIWFKINTKGFLHPRIKEELNAAT